MRYSLLPLVILGLSLIPILTVAKNEPEVETTKPRGKNVLFFLGFTTYSHRISMWPLVQKMADEGYNITFLSSHPPKSLADPRVHEYVPASFVHFNSKLLSIDLLAERLKGFSQAQGMWDAFPSVAVGMYEMLVKEEYFQNWLQSSNFDLIFMDSLYCEFALGLAYKFKSLVALFSTTSPYMWQNDAIGAPTESWIPDFQFALPDGIDMTFSQKVLNTLKPIYWNLVRSWSYFPQLEKLFRDDLGLTDMPGLAELEKNVSLLLANTHYSEEYARSVPPNVISIGGLHCSQTVTKEDLKDLGKFMDGSGTAGFIYVSLGSAAKVSNLPPHLREIFFEAMRKASTKFVLKWEGQPPANLPKNVFLAEWLPQQNVLAHPNIKGFITHGGLLGVQEAVCASVPMIFFPVFGEQDYNGNRFHKRGSGIKLSFNTLTLQQLEDSIHKIVTEPSYKINMEKTSKLFKDRPQEPLVTAMWWVNYILRHGHVESLQPLGIHQSWWERRGLDVYFFVFSLIMVAIFITLKIIIFIIFKLFANRTTLSQSKSRHVRFDKKKK